MKRACTSICLLVLFFGFASVAMSAAYNSQEKEYWLFVGNPNGGKSKIINSLLQKQVANSGLSIGVGLTKDYALYPNPNGNIVYIDTPGLDDVNTRADAAKEIEKALKQDGKYRIFFVIESNGLRMRPTDLATMEIILDAINLPNIEYNIIVNKITEPEVEALKNDYNNALFHEYLKPGKYINRKIRQLSFDDSVSRNREKFINMKSFLQFAYTNSASIYLPKNSIRTVNGQTWDEKLKNAQTKLDLAKKEIDENKEKLKKALDEVAKLEKEIEEEKETDWAKIAITTFTVAVTVVEVVTTVAPFL